MVSLFVYISLTSCFVMIFAPSDKNPAKALLFVLSQPWTYIHGYKYFVPMGLTFFVNLFQDKTLRRPVSPSPSRPVAPSPRRSLARSPRLSVAQSLPLSVAQSLRRSVSPSPSLSLAQSLPLSVARSLSPLLTLRLSSNSSRLSSFVGYRD